jgi:hypothetical protein
MRPETKRVKTMIEWTLRLKCAFVKTVFEKFLYINSKKEIESSYRRNPEILPLTKW